MKDKKEEIIIKKTIYHRIADTLCVIILVGSIIYLAVKYGTLPDKIPMHYDFSGNIDRWGSKSGLWFCPVLAVILTVGISVLERFPSAWNTGVEITPQNRDEIYSLLMNLIKTLKLGIVIIFSLLSLLSVNGKSLPLWFVPVELLIILAPLIYFIVKVFKAGKK